MKFDYEFEVLRDVGDFDRFIRELKDRGEEGWELCGFEYGCAFFKKERGK